MSCLGVVASWRLYGRELTRVSSQMGMVSGESYMLSWRRYNGHCCIRDIVEGHEGLMTEEVEQTYKVDERLSYTHSSSLLLFCYSTIVCTLFWRSYYFLDLDCTTFLTCIAILFLTHTLIVSYYYARQFFYFRSYVIFHLNIDKQLITLNICSDMFRRCISEISTNMHLWYNSNVNDFWVGSIECLKWFRKCISEIFQHLFKNRCVRRCISENWGHLNNFMWWLRSI